MDLVVSLRWKTQVASTKWFPGAAAAAACYCRLVDGYGCDQCGVSGGILTGDAIVESSWCELKDYDAFPECSGLHQRGNIPSLPCYIGRTHCTAGPFECMLWLGQILVGEHLLRGIR
nr:hypothetical transcript [Hymenolepis microstoma]